MKGNSVIVVVAGGFSVSKITKEVRDNLVNEACVIGVNDSALHMPVDYAISMDRKWLEGRHDAIKELGVDCYYRVCTAKNVKPQQPQFKPFFGNIWRAQMTLDPGHLWGDNSGKVALNLAYQLAPTRVFMLGFDMKPGPNGEAHWYAPYPWGGGTKPGKLRGWAGNFDYIAHQFESAGIELRNVTGNADSLITPESVQRCSIKDFNSGDWKGKLKKHVSRY